MGHKKMADPVTNLQIEDVLSSIRKLVSEEVRAQTRGRSAPPRVEDDVEPEDAPRPVERLVLTPSFRVAPEDETAPRAAADPAGERAAQRPRAARPARQRGTQPDWLTAVAAMDLRGDPAADEDAAEAEWTEGDFSRLFDGDADVDDNLTADDDLSRLDGRDAAPVHETVDALPEAEDPDAEFDMTAFQRMHLSDDAGTDATAEAEAPEVELFDETDLPDELLSDDGLIDAPAVGDEGVMLDALDLSDEDWADDETGTWADEEDGADWDDADDDAVAEATEAVEAAFGSIRSSLSDSAEEDAEAFDAEHEDLAAFDQLIAGFEPVDVADEAYDDAATPAPERAPADHSPASLVARMAAAGYGMSHDADAGKPAPEATGQGAIPPFLRRRGVTSLETRIAELESDLGAGTVTPAPSADDTADSETLAWEDHVEDAPAAFVPDPDAEPDMDEAEFEAYAAPATADWDDLPVDADEDGADDTSILDEEMLRQMVVEIVRQELQGALGERITRNVRKLVRREIQRALTSQDLM